MGSPSESALIDGYLMDADADTFERNDDDEATTSSMHDGRGMFGRLHRAAVDANELSAGSMPTKRRGSDDVERLAFYHGVIDAATAQRRLTRTGDYLLRIDPKERTLILSIRHTDVRRYDDLVHQELIKTTNNGTTYRLPTLPHAKNVSAYINYFLRLNVPVVANAFLHRAINRPDAGVINHKSLRSDIAVRLPADHRRNWLLPFGQRPMQQLFYFHGVLTVEVAERRCLNDGRVGAFLLWVDARDGTAVMSVRGAGDGVVHHVALQRTAHRQHYDYQLPSGGGSAQTEEEYINYYHYYDMPLLDDVYLKFAVPAISFGGASRATVRPEPNKSHSRYNGETERDDIMTAESDDIATATTPDDLATALPGQIDTNAARVQNILHVHTSVPQMMARRQMAQSRLEKSENCQYQHGRQ